MIYVIDMGEGDKRLHLYEYKARTWDWWEFIPVHADALHGAHLTQMFHLSDNDSKVMVF